MRMDNNNTKTLTTIERTFEIVKLVKERDGARVSQVAEELDMPRSTAHNYLGTLCEEGYLVKDGDEYRIGLQFLGLGGHAASRQPGYQLLRTKVNQLADETKERAQVIAEENGRGIYIYEMTCSNAVQTDVQIGKHVHLHTTSAGKAILAHLPEERLKQIIDYWGLPERTEYTITDEEELRNSLQNIRGCGYAFNDEERIKGQRAVGVPVLDEKNDIVTALSVSGPKNRLKGDWFTEEIPDILLGIANEIELNLKFSGRNR